MIKRSDWFEGLLYAERMYSQGNQLKIPEECKGKSQEFQSGTMDYMVHYGKFLMRGNNNAPRKTQ